MINASIIYNMNAHTGKPRDHTIILTDTMAVKYFIKRRIYQPFFFNQGSPKTINRRKKVITCKICDNRPTSVGNVIPFALVVLFYLSNNKIICRTVYRSPDTKFENIFPK